MSSLFGSTRNTRVLKGGSIDAAVYQERLPEKLCERRYSG
jgi:hypothetical protein